MTSLDHLTPGVAEAATELFGDALPAATKYAELLVGPGMDRGLIGPREGGRVWERHVLNCAAIATALPAGADVVDIGSGAGLPGIPLALARPDISVRLVESLNRRVIWLREVVEVLDLVSRVSVVAARAEDVSGPPGGVVVSRAVAPLRRLLPWCARLTSVGGTIVAIKGDRAMAELAEVSPSLPGWGLGDARVSQFGADLLSQPTIAVVARRMTVDTPDPCSRPSHTQRRSS